MSDVSLRLSGITKTYNAGTPAAVDVLRGVDATLTRGEVVALVAPSGAGKSTLLHIAGLLDTPDAGIVEIAGRTSRARIGPHTRRGAAGSGACLCTSSITCFRNSSGTGKHRAATS